MITVYNSGANATISGETYTIDKGTATPSAPLPSPLTDLSGGGPVSDQDLTTQIFIPNGAVYLAVKWDGNNGGGAYYDVSSLDGTYVTLSESDASVFTDKTINPSGYEIWSASSNTVPDGTSTVMVLGATLTGLGLIRRKIVSK